MNGEDRESTELLAKKVEQARKRRNKKVFLAIMLLTVFVIGGMLRVYTLSNDVDGLDQRVGVLRTDVEQAEVRSAANRQHITTNAANIAKQKVQLDAQDERFDNLDEITERTVAKLQDALVALKEATLVLEGVSLK